MFKLSFCLAVLKIYNKFSYLVKKSCYEFTCRKIFLGNAGKDDFFYA